MMRHHQFVAAVGAQVGFGPWPRSVNQEVTGSKVVSASCARTTVQVAEA